MILCNTESEVHGHILVNKMTEHPAKPSKVYKSAFDKWDKQSWVRSKPHQEQLAPFDPSLTFYSQDLALLFAHEKVSRAPTDIRNKLLALHLYNYLEFTVWLEMGPVNEVCELLRREDFLPWLPAQMKSDAIKIYVDEGGHAQMSHALIVAAEEYTGLKKIKKQRPAFLDMLDALVQREEREFHPLITLFFVIISETLITGTLVKLPKDDTVQSAVRGVARDHASDEGRHHAYFREILEYFWPRLPRDIRKKIGLLLPDMILAFLRPDREALVKMLQVFPQVFSHPEDIVQDLIGRQSTIDGIRESAAPTIKMLRDNKVFEDDHIREAFIVRELLIVDYNSSK